MSRLLACLVLAACGVPGEPDTIVVGGEPLAGYAWSGPDSCACEDILTPSDGMVNVGWQIWFTNTDFCPTNFEQPLAVLSIFSSERTFRPSTELPTLDSPVVPISPFVGESVVTEPVARLGIDDYREVEGTLILTIFGTDGIRGSFTGLGSPIGGSKVDVHGEFHARPCGRIHD